MTSIDETGAPSGGGNPIYRLAHYFSTLPDPRVARTQRHLFHEILMISLCASLCGADGFVAIADFGRARREWLETFLALPGGIPSHDTFNRVFAMIDPGAFAECFAAWTSDLQAKSDGRLVAIDGKRVRGSFDEATGKAAIHMVSAWASRGGLALGQVKVDEKSNEITAIPRLLEMLDAEGSVVTIDAMGTQKQIARLIQEKKADYVLALKDNHPTLREDAQIFLDAAAESGFADAFGRPIPHDACETVDKGHGRLEIRRCWCTAAIDWLDGREEWAGLRTIALVESERTAAGRTAVARRYYLSSLAPDAKRILKAARGHWGIENKLHWVLDMAFDEDRCRVRMGHAPQNLATLRHLTINLLKRETSRKMGIARKRLMAGWDAAYLAKIIMGGWKD